MNHHGVNVVSLTTSLLEKYSQLHHSLEVTRNERAAVQQDHQAKEQEYDAVYQEGIDMEIHTQELEAMILEQEQEQQEREDRSNDHDNHDPNDAHDDDDEPQGDMLLSELERELEHAQEKLQRMEASHRQSLLGWQNKNNQKASEARRSSSKSKKKTKKKTTQTRDDGSSPAVSKPTTLIGVAATLGSSITLEAALQVQHNSNMATEEDASIHHIDNGKHDDDSLMVVADQIAHHRLTKSKTTIDWEKDMKDWQQRLTAAQHEKRDGTPVLAELTRRVDDLQEMQEKRKLQTERLQAQYDRLMHVDCHSLEQQIAEKQGGVVVSAAAYGNFAPHHLPRAKRHRSNPHPAVAAAQQQEQQRCKNSSSMRMIESNPYRRRNKAQQHQQPLGPQQPSTNHMYGTKLSTAITPSPKPTVHRRGSIIPHQQQPFRDEDHDGSFPHRAPGAGGGQERRRRRFYNKQGRPEFGMDHSRSSFDHLRGRTVFGGERTAAATTTTRTATTVTVYANTTNGVKGQPNRRHHQSTSAATAADAAADDGLQQPKKVKSGAASRTTHAIATTTPGDGQRPPRYSRGFPTAPNRVRFETPGKGHIDLPATTATATTPTSKKSAFEDTSSDDDSETLVSYTPFLSNKAEKKT